MASTLAPAPIAQVRPTHPSPRRPGTSTAAHLRALAATAARDLEAAPAVDVLRWAATTFGGGFCVTSSMSHGVLAHLAAQALPGVDVVFVDTGYHFVETLGTRDAVEASPAVNVITLTPRTSVRHQDVEHGRDLWAADPDACCALRKVQPLRAGLAAYTAWASGIRRDQSALRSKVPVIRYDEPSGQVVVCPLATWTSRDVQDYIKEHSVPVNPLRLDGYPSIGCWPCTRRAEPGADERSGRWPEFTKKECGIHS